jgi:hypothetical protein
MKFFNKKKPKDTINYYTFQDDPRRGGSNPRMPPPYNNMNRPSMPQPYNNMNNQFNPQMPRPYFNNFQNPYFQQQQQQLFQQQQQNDCCCTTCKETHIPLYGNDRVCGPIGTMMPLQPNVTIRIPIKKKGSLRPILEAEDSDSDYDSDHDSDRDSDSDDDRNRQFMETQQFVNSDLVINIVQKKSKKSSKKSTKKSKAKTNKKSNKPALSATPSTASTPIGSVSTDISLKSGDLTKQILAKDKEKRSSTYDAKSIGQDFSSSELDSSFSTVADSSVKTPSLKLGNITEQLRKDEKLNKFSTRESPQPSPPPSINVPSSSKTSSVYSRNKTNSTVSSRPSVGTNSVASSNRTSTSNKPETASIASSKPQSDVKFKLPKPNLKKVDERQSPDLIKMKTSDKKGEHSNKKHDANSDDLQSKQRLRIQVRPIPTKKEESSPKKTIQFAE